MSNQPQLALPEEYVYQGYGRKKIIVATGKRKATGLLAKPGSGKTRMILEALRDSGAMKKPILILCSGPAMATWRKEIPKWLGSEHDITIVGRVGNKQVKPPQRHALWINATQRGHSNSVAGSKTPREVDVGFDGNEQPVAPVGRFYITNYSLFLRDFEHIYGDVRKKGLHWGGVIADEYHKAFKRRKSDTFDRYKRLTQFVPFSVATSGSADLHKDPSALFTLLHICDRRRFRGYWKFVDNWCTTKEGFDDRTVITGARPETLEAFKREVDEHIAFIPDTVIAHQLPEGRRMPLNVLMDKQQEDIYESFAQDMIAEIEEEMVMSPNALDLHIKLQKILCCPKMISPTLGMGAGYEAILDRLEVEPHAMIFVPFREACEWVSEALKVDLKTQNVFMMRGQIGMVEQTRCINEFRRTKGIIVCTIAYAESFDCETCDTSYFLGYGTDIGQLVQAEGRTQRAISKHLAVVWYYLRYENTIDADALWDIAESHANIKRVTARPERFIAALRGDDYEDYYDDK